MKESTSKFLFSASPVTHSFNFTGTMKLLQFTLLAASLSAALALPSDISPRQSACTSPKLRKEWSKATRAEQQSYIKAVLCLATKPSRIGLETTLYDDFAYVHSSLTMQSESIPPIKWLMADNCVW